MLVAAVLATPAYAGQGWYLMVPWTTTGPPRTPVAEWDHSSSFDKASECEDSLSRSITLRDQQIRLGTGTPDQLKASKRMLDRLTWARCIASDDPRLK